MLHNWSILLADDWQHAVCVCNWACDARYSACKHPFSADMLVFQKPLTSVMQAVFVPQHVFNCAVFCVKLTGRATLMNLGSLDISSSSLSSAEQVVHKYTHTYTLWCTHPSSAHTHAAGHAPFIVQFLSALFCVCAYHYCHCWSGTCMCSWHSYIH